MKKLLFILTTVILLTSCGYSDKLISENTNIPMEIVEQVNELNRNPSPAWCKTIETQGTIYIVNLTETGEYKLYRKISKVNYTLIPFLIVVGIFIGVLVTLSFCNK